MMFRHIFQLCCGVRKHYGSSSAWAESATDQDPDAPTDFDGVMPPYKDAEDVSRCHVLVDRVD